MNDKLRKCAEKLHADVSIGAGGAGGASGASTRAVHPIAQTQLQRPANLHHTATGEELTNIALTTSTPAPAKFCVSVTVSLLQLYAMSVPSLSH